MNINGSFKFSIVIHLSVLLLMLFVSGFSTARVSPLSIYLISEATSKQEATGTDLSEEMTEDTAKEEERTLQDSQKNVDNNSRSGAESFEPPSQSKSPLHSEVDMKSEDIENKIQNALLMMRTRRMAYIHTRAFANSAGSDINFYIRNALLNLEMQELNGLSAEIKINYNEDGALEKVEVLSASDELKTVLEPISWMRLPLPSAYYLKCSSLNVRVSIRNNIPVVSLMMM